VDAVHEEEVFLFVYEEIPLRTGELIVSHIFKVALELREQFGNVLEWHEDIRVHEHFLRFEAIHEFLAIGAVISAGHGVRRATDVIKAKHGYSVGYMDLKRLG
jgi:hypothetical protein